MKRTRPTLGLHTVKERVDALAMAKDAYKTGLQAAEGGAPMEVAFYVGYLKSLSDLARQEHAVDLYTDLDLLRSRLEEKLQEILGLI